jgi:hypothetical protein
MAPGSPTPSGKAEGRPPMDPRRATERLKAWVVPNSWGGVGSHRLFARGGLVHLGILRSR